MSNLQTVVDQILDARRAIPAQRSVLTAITGIDGCGKGGLPPAETIRAYRTIYFPAQAIHCKRDDPKAAATVMVNNDLRLGSVC